MDFEKYSGFLQMMGLYAVVTIIGDYLKKK